MSAARVVLLLAAAVLHGCGFAPLYGARDGVSPVEEMAAVRVSSIGDRSGQILRNHLIDGLSPRGESVPALYRLNVRIEEPRIDLAFRRDDTVSRVGYSAVARFELSDGSGRKIFEGVSSSSTSYEVTDSQFATLSSRNNARDRVMELIAEDIRQRLAVFFVERRARTPTS